MTTPSQASVSASTPTEKTLRAAVLVLSALAVVQALAALAILAPALRISAVTSPREVVQAPSVPVEMPAVPSAPVPPAAADTASVAVETSPDVIAQANAMLEQADALREQGNLEGAFAALQEADYLIPNEPGILYQMAVVAFEMGRLTDSRELASRAVAIPSLRADPNYAMVYQQLTLLLNELGAPTPGVSSTGQPTGAPEEAMPPPGAPPRPRPMEGPSGGAGMLRDDAGIPIGSTFGIVQSRITDGDDGAKVLSVATKAAPHEEIDASDFKVAVYFYEQRDDGSIVETDGNVMSEWLSPPIDWADGEPELLELRYPTPESRGENDRGLQYYGYVIGIYFQGDLQDSRGEPVALLEQFPLPLTSSGADE